MVGISILGLAMLLIGAWMLWRKKSKKVVTWMWLVAGFSLGGGIADVIANVFSAAGGAGGRLFSVGTGAFLSIIGVVMMLELWHGAHPKKGQPKTHHPILALVAPIMVGVGTGGALHSIVLGISSALSHLSGPLAALIGG